jgi:hypothetical protein
MRHEKNDLNQLLRGEKRNEREGLGARTAGFQSKVEDQGDGEEVHLG